MYIKQKSICQYASICVCFRNFQNVAILELHDM